MYNFFMAKLARMVVPGLPHHITQRGNRRQKVFFKDNDYQAYLNILQKCARENSVKLVLYCLMPNHVHIIAVPEKKDSLAKTFGETHKKYTKMINARNKWGGFLWQGRFNSYVLGESHFYLAARYILLNPVRAGMVKSADSYKWSSIKHHMRKDYIRFLQDGELQCMVNGCKEFLSEEVEEKDAKLFKRHESTGKPLGDENFVFEIGKILNINLIKKKPGPKLKGVMAASN